MRINELLNEAAIQPYTKAELGDLDMLRASLIANCSDALSKFSYKKALFRGSQSLNMPFGVIDSSTGIRKSANTSNYYTLLFDNNPLLAEFPKRSKSFVCTTDRDEASRYSSPKWGGLYILFPFNGVNIGICPSRDFWGIDVTIPELGLNKQSIRFINTILQQLGIPQRNFEDLKNEFKTPDFAENYKKFVDNTMRGQKHWFVDPDILKPARNPATLLNTIFKRMSPEKLGVTFTDIGRFSVPEDRECWFSGPCIAIRNDTYNTLIEDGFFDDLLKGGR